MVSCRRNHNNRKATTKECDPLVSSVIIVATSYYDDNSGVKDFIDGLVGVDDALPSLMIYPKKRGARQSHPKTLTLLEPSVSSQLSVCSS